MLDEYSQAERLVIEGALRIIDGAKTPGLQDVLCKDNKPFCVTPGYNTTVQIDIDPNSERYRPVDLELFRKMKELYDSKTPRKFVRDHAYYERRLTWPTKFFFMQFYSLTTFTKTFYNLFSMYLKVNPVKLLSTTLHLDSDGNPFPLERQFMLNKNFYINDNYVSNPRTQFDLLQHLSTTLFYPPTAIYPGFTRTEFASRRLKLKTGLLADLFFASFQWSKDSDTNFLEDMIGNRLSQSSKAALYKRTADMNPHNLYMSEGYRCNIGEMISLSRELISSREYPEIQRMLRNNMKKQRFMQLKTRYSLDVKDNEEIPKPVPRPIDALGPECPTSAGWPDFVRKWVFDGTNPVIMTLLSGEQVKVYIHHSPGGNQCYMSKLITKHLLDHEYYIVALIQGDDVLITAHLPIDGRPQRLVIEVDWSACDASVKSGLIQMEMDTLSKTNYPSNLLAMLYNISAFKPTIQLRKPRTTYDTRPKDTKRDIIKLKLTSGGKAASEDSRKTGSSNTSSGNSYLNNLVVSIILMVTSSRSNGYLDTDFVKHLGLPNYAFTGDMGACIKLIGQLYGVLLKVNVCNITSTINPYLGSFMFLKHYLMWGVSTHPQTNMPQNICVFVLPVARIAKMGKGLLDPISGPYDPSMKQQMLDAKLKQITGRTGREAVSYMKAIYILMLSFYPKTHFWSIVQKILTTDESLKFLETFKSSMSIKSIGDIRKHKSWMQLLGSTFTYMGDSDMDIDYSMVEVPYEYECMFYNKLLYPKFGGQHTFESMCSDLLNIQEDLNSGAVVFFHPALMYLISLAV